MHNKIKYIEARAWSHFVARSKDSTKNSLLLMLMLSAFCYYYLGELPVNVAIWMSLLIAVVAMRFYLTRMPRFSELQRLSSTEVRALDGLTIVTGILWGGLLGSGFIRSHEEIVPWDVFVLGGVSSAATSVLVARRHLIRPYFYLMYVGFVSFFWMGSVHHSGIVELYVFASVLFTFCVFITSHTLKGYKSLEDLYVTQYEAAKQKDLFESLIEAVPGYVSVIGPDQKYRYFNTKLKSSFEKDISKAKLGDFAPASEAVIETRRFIESGALSYSAELNIEMPGDLRPKRYMAHWQRSQVSDDVVVMCFDIDELHQNRTALIRQKETLSALSNLKSLAELTAGIAHEINNPISIISGYPELIEYHAKNLPPSQDAQSIVEYCAVIKSGANRVSRIVQSMKAMASRNSVLKNSEVSLFETLSDLYLLCETKILSSGIRLIKPDQEKLGFVRGNSIQIIQILLNLIWNARDALEESAAYGIQKYVAINVVSTKTRLKLSVSDNGKGIEQNIADHIMNASFSTKEGGLGLGLSLSKAMAERMGGELYIESLSNPTVFVLELDLIEMPR